MRLATEWLDDPHIRAVLDALEAGERARVVRRRLRA